MVDDTGLKRKLRALVPKVEARLKPLMEKYAAQIVAEMKAAAPEKTGALRDSIGWTWGDAPAGTIRLAQINGRQSKGVFITIYAGGKDVFYARMQEFGTRKMLANPFFYPVWRSNRPRVRAGITRAVNKAIKEI